MMDKRLTAAVRGSKRYVAAQVLLQWLGLLANIGMMFAIAGFLEGLWLGAAGGRELAGAAGAVVAAVAARYLCAAGASRVSRLAAGKAKQALRRSIYQKLLALGAGYRSQVSTAEAVQLAVEGVDQLEPYFGAYLPQLFYSLLAPVTLFCALAPVNLPAAAVLLACVPLIPAAIMAVRAVAKALLAKYWGQYTRLGDSFLENLQGLTTLKIYQADGDRHRRMNEEFESFRKSTMRVLTMQLQSVTVMDLLAYGGAALGVGLAAVQFRAGSVTLAGALTVMLLSAEFFLPMRRLGSLFHIAMNGLAAAEKIFRLLELPEPETGRAHLSQEQSGVVCRGLSFTYDGQRQALREVDFELSRTGFVALVGESGSGKSTLAAVLTGKVTGYRGSVTVGGTELSDLAQHSLLRHVTYVGHAAYLFKGTVRDNLRMAAPDAGDGALWAALERARLADFLREGQGLDTLLTERGANLSGGQRQRLALARALLHDSPIYIFDESTSNIDPDSEAEILAAVHALAREKAVLFISHRLANVAHAQRIYVMEDGRVAAQGTHRELLRTGGTYERLWNTQKNLEEFGRETVAWKQPEPAAI